MKAIDGESIGRRIAEARARRGLTQADLASATSLDRSAIAKIENGLRRISALELARIASVVGERIEWFVMETPPAIVSHRNVAEPGAESSTIDRSVERVAWNVEFVAEHDERLGMRSPAVLAKPCNSADAERSAVEARRILRLNSVEPLFDISGRAAEIGLLIFSLDLGVEAADAALIHLRNGGVAVVNGHLHVGRRRLAAAHELGHYLFAEEYAVDWRVSDRDDDDAWESRLDRFARAVLLPTRGLRESWDGLRSGGDDLRTTCVKLASRFRVDMSTLARRLVELGMISQTDAQAVRAMRTTRADIVEFNLVVNDELAAPCLPRAYEAAVVRLYRQEVISAARATDLLFELWDDQDLPDLPTLPESAVWNLV
ncbi:MAG TPA: XRE family transcriptional regulator [Micromonosporaceae bacterium]